MATEKEDVIVHLSDVHRIRLMIFEIQRIDAKLFIETFIGQLCCNYGRLLMIKITNEQITRNDGQKDNSIEGNKHR